MADKNYKYRVTLNQAGKPPVEYKTETLELAESIKNLYTNVQKKYKIPPEELFVVIAPNTR